MDTSDFDCSGDSQRPKIAEHPITGLRFRVIFQETDLPFRFSSLLNRLYIDYAGLSAALLC